MHKALKEAGLICKTMMRNGYDAHIINAPLQELLLEIRPNADMAIDIACEPGFEQLLRLFPNAIPEEGKESIATLTENGVTFRFYQLDSNSSSPPELALLRLTPSMLDSMSAELRSQIRDGGRLSESVDPYGGFAEVRDGSIRLLGVPDLTLSHNYLLGIRAIRFAANFDVEIEPNTWMAIIRSSARILDYVPIRDIMKEWRKVAAESMHKFVKLLYDSHILHGLIPEIANLAAVAEENTKGGEKGNVLEHTLKCMELYPQNGLHYDWLGTFAMLFHDIGKLYTAEYFNGRWTYFQHHRVGSKVTRRILRRLGFDLRDADLVCHLVDQHMRFHFMLTDQGIRKFTALSEGERLIAMARADILSREGSFTSFNHNLKYLERADTPRQLLEPLLNGNEIMKVANLTPGRNVGVIRDALLAAQKSGDVANRAEADAFVRFYALQLKDEN